MILKGSQRGGAIQLSNHLLNRKDNEHVTVFEVRGFVGETLPDAFAEAHAVAKGTKCQQFLFSLSLNPPAQEQASEVDFIQAANAAEEKLGLAGHPRIIVFHEKHGRRHAHAVWSRIDAETMTAVNLPFYKQKLTDLSRELYLDHEWKLPDGLKENGGRNPLNFTLAEWQQAKRLDLDPRELRQVFQEAWQRSDSAQAFAKAIEERGYFLAQGDLRGFVAVDVHGEVHAIARLTGVKTKDVEARLGSPDTQPPIAEVRAEIADRLRDQVKGYIADVRAKQADDRRGIEAARDAMAQSHEREREMLAAKQKERDEQERRERQARFNTGLRGLWDRLTGRAGDVHALNEREAMQAMARDRAQRDRLIHAQLEERRTLQKQFDDLKAKHAEERKLLAREIVRHIRKPPEKPRREVDQTRERGRTRGPEFPGP